MKKTIQLSFILFTCFGVFAQKKHTISGYIKEKGSQEHLIGVNVIVKNTAIGTSSNTYGFYSLTIPENQNLELIFSFVGYNSVEKTIVLNKDTELNIEIGSNNVLEEITVSAKKQSDKVSEDIQMSKIEIPIQQIKKLPAFLGERDVLKILQLMPGVQKGSEGQTGIYVRGGGPDQNLIILDDANVYNASHLFGFFSVFNGDALKSVELTKGGFPARYGGRLSSVIDLNMKEGNKEKFTGEGGIGLISSRLTLEGPIVKNKASFLVSARRTYLDVLAQPLIKAAQTGENEATVGYYFYDLNAKLNFDINRKNKIYLSSYMGKDIFYAKDNYENNKSDNGLNWGNITSTLRWNYLINKKLFSNLSLTYTDYNFNIFSKMESTYNNRKNTTSLNYNSAIRDLGIKQDFDFFPNPNHAIKFGLQGIYHTFNPSAIVLKDDENNFSRNQKPIDVIEAGIYGEDVWSIGNKLKVNYGLRISNYQAIGQTLWRPEPRVSMAYKASKDLSIKLSYSKMNQYVHLLSNSGIGLPTDLWVPSTTKVKPQSSEQIALGLAKDIESKGLSVTLEGYYKKMNNILSLKEGASFLFLEDPESAVVAPSWEDNVTQGRGWSYGTEFLVQKKYGRFTGWTGYTLSWTKWQFTDLNFGKVFYPKFDRRNDLSIVGIYELSKRITLSSTWVYGTGNSLSIPVSTYSSSEHSYNPILNKPISSDQSPSNTIFNNYRQVQEYGEKNSFRAEPYHRLDVSVQFHKKKKRHDRTWEISVYNAYNRRNPFFYQIDQSYDQRSQTITTGLKRYSLFPIVPSFSYNFKF